MPRSQPYVRRWTRDEYYRLTDLGFFNDQRVELIKGRIIKMPGMKNPHAMGIGLLQDALQAAFGQSHWVRIQLPLALSPVSEPQPDLAVIPGRPRDCTDPPTTAQLVVEVSDTSLAFDRGVKLQLYAEAGVTDYWIVNLVDRQLEVYRDPKASPAKATRFLYAQVTTLTAADSIAPLAAPQAKIAVADLLP